MATEPKRHCPRNHPAYFGRRCPECEKQRNNLRGTSSSRGYDSEWRTFRGNFLAKFPKCIECGDFATDVDHIKSLREGGNKLDETNCRSMCHRCHSRRTGRDQVNVGRK